MPKKSDSNFLSIEHILAHKILVLIVICAGLFLRFYRYDNIPFGINHDSSAVALEAIDISQNPLPYRPYSTIDAKGETLILYLFAIPIRLFGHSPSHIKLYSTMISCLLLPIFYVTVRTIFSKQIAFTSLLFLSLSGWHIIMGKTVWPAILLPITECIFLYFLYKTIIYNKYLDSALTGVSLALVMNSYNAAKFVPIYFIIIVFYVLFRSKRSVNVKNLKLFIVFSIFFAIFISPLALFIKNNRDQYISRGSSLYVGNRIKETGNLSPLKENFIQTISMFTVRANGNDFFVNEPLLDPPSSYLLVIGLCTIIYLIVNTKYQLLLIGFVLSLLPGFVSVPNGNRGIGSLPFVYLIIGIGFYYVLKIVGKINRQFAVLFLYTVMLVTFFVTFNLYLGKNRRELFGFYPETTIVANYIRPRLGQYDVYLTDNYPRDILTFLTFKSGDPFYKQYTWVERREDFLKEKMKDKGMLFVMSNNLENREFIPTLISYFPNGSVSMLEYDDNSINRTAALLYTVPK